jgi:hypothetical protein
MGLASEHVGYMWAEMHCALHLIASHSCSGHTGDACLVVSVVFRLNERPINARTVVLLKAPPVQTDKKDQISPWAACPRLPLTAVASTAAVRRPDQSVSPRARAHAYAFHARTRTHALQCTQRSDTQPCAPATVLSSIPYPKVESCGRCLNSWGGGCKCECGEHDSGAPLAEHLFIFLSIKRPAHLAATRESRNFATAASCHSCRAAARYAACAWSRRCTIVHEFGVPPEPRSRRGGGRIWRGG